MDDIVKVEGTLEDRLKHIFDLENGVQEINLTKADLFFRDTRERRIVQKNVFKYWLALPDTERRIKTRKDLAEFLEVDEDVLNDWYSQPSFIAEVRKIQMDILSSSVPDVLSALSEQAKDGSFHHQKLFLEMLNIYTPTNTTKIEGGINNSGNINFESLVKNKEMLSFLVGLMAEHELCKSHDMSAKDLETIFIDTLNRI